MKFLLPVKIILTWCAILFSEYVVAQYSNVMIISGDQTTLPGPNGQVTNVACKEIRLVPGYQFVPQPGRSMRAYINPYLDCDIDYISGFSATTPPPLNTSLEVGTAPGSFAVTQTGAATYNIPLVIPPGTAGMVPNLSISYNSQVGDGLLGVGWSLSGLSAITRVGKTLYHDGSISPVTLSSSDRFALNGNRLFASSGVYGESGTVYATEIESFSRIVSGGTPQINGPQFFKVETKDGSILDYGYTEDSRIEVSGVNNTVLTWLLNKVTDSRGNYMNIHYTENNGNGTFRPDYIEYTGNFNFPTLTPYNIIKFVYGTRQDRQEYWIAGHPTRQNVLLTGIEMYAQGSLVHRYEFNYSYSMGSHLSDVIEKGTDGRQFNSTKFFYEDTYDISPQVSSFVTNATLSGSTAPIYSLDFNGDGFSDIVRIENNNLYQFVNNGNGTFSSSLSPINIGSYHGISLGGKNIMNADLNADGIDDLLLVSGVISWLGQEVEDPGFKAYFSNGTSYSSSPSITISFTDGKSKFTLGDYDGDGATDLFIHFYTENKCSIYSFRLNGYLVYQQPLDIGNETLQFHTTDLDGDGKNEILFTFTNPWTDCNGYNSYSQVLEFNGSYLASVSGCLGYPNGYYKIFPGDFNGDGKTDILTWANSNGWEVGYSMGDKHNFSVVSMGMQNNGDPAETVGNDVPKNNHLYWVADYNGDGKSDIINLGIANWIGSDPGATWIEIWYSTGMGFTTGYFNTQNNNDLTMYPLRTSPHGDYNGDGHLEFITKRGDNSNYETVEFIPDKNIHTVQQIINGLNHVTRINYNTLPLLSQQGKYVKGTDLLTYPVIHFQKALTVVSQTEPDNGIGGTNTTDYAYEGAKIHLTGKGFLGFTKVKSTDQAAGVVSENTYETGMTWLTNPNHPFFQPVLKNSKTYLAAGNQGISETIIDPFNNGYSFVTGGSLPLGDNSGKRYHFYAKKVVTNDLLHGNSSETNTQQDNFGNITIQTSTSTAETIVTTNIYEQKTWIPAHLITSQTVTTRTNEPPYPRSVTYENNAIGALLSKKIEDVGITSQYLYNTYGVPETTIVSGINIPTSTTTNEYDNKKRFVTKQTNAAGHTVEMTYDDAYGSMLTNKDANNLLTQYKYDGFGRLKETTTPTNQKVTVTRSWEIGTIPNSVYAITTSHPGTPTAKEFYDVLGRVLRTETQGFDGSAIFVNKTYNNLGQLVNESEPNDNSLLTSYTYESDFKRLKTVTSPGGTSVAYSYNGNTTNITTTAGSSIRNSSKTLDASGALISSTDEGGTLSYLYHSSGKPRQITAPGGAITTMTYDQFGRQTQLNDPNAGLMTYTYDILGQLKTQTDARGNIYSMTYDVLGRMLTKTGTEGTIGYTYDTKPNGKGMIASVTGFNGINSDYTYDSQSRLAGKTEQNIDGGNYAFGYQYDNLNRVTQITYPSGFAMKREYNTTGYLEKIKKVDNSLLWQCNSMTPRLQVATAQQGNGTLSKTYTNLGFLQNITRIENSAPAMNLNFGFNALTGNLDNRIDNIHALNETFVYDDLDRLTNITNINQSQQISYLPSGNISSKTDAGPIYNYATLPHAVSSIDNPNANIPAVQQDITYTAFQKADLITEGNYTLQFTYGHDYQRKISELKNSGNTERKIIYLGNYEEIITASGTYKVHYISSSDGLVAVNVKHDNNPDQLFFVHTDHLGSIIALYDANGNKVYEQNFDAWGRDRNPNDWTYTANPNTKPEWLIRGFTGHEHHPEFALVNMNGRMYDPLVARMLSPDNYVQSADFTQMFNRYTYAGNNPLVYVDPDGEWVWLIPAIIGGVINVATNWNNIDNFWQGLGYFGAGAVSGGLAVTGPIGWAAGGAITGAANTALAGGNRDQIIQSAFAGALGGVAGGAFGQWAGKNLGGVLINSFRVEAQSAIGGLITGGIGGAAGGYAGGFMGGFITTGNFATAHQAGIQGLKTGAVVGGAVGAGYGYYSASQAGRNPLTGKPNQPITPKDLRGITKPTVVQKEGRTFEIKPRTQGTSSDRSDSYHVIEIVGGERISITQIVVSPKGFIIHQHQYFIGESGSQYYNPKLSEFPTIDLQIKKD